MRTTQRDVHIHILEVDDNPAAGDYLLLRDHLRADEPDRRLYESTKREPIKAQWSDMNAYAALHDPGCSCGLNPPDSSRLRAM